MVNETGLLTMGRLFWIKFGVDNRLIPRKIGASLMILLKTRFSFVINELRRNFNGLLSHLHLVRFILVYACLTVFEATNGEQIGAQIP